MFRYFIHIALACLLVIFSGCTGEQKTDTTSAEALPAEEKQAEKIIAEEEVAVTVKEDVPVTKEAEEEVSEPLAEPEKTQPKVAAKPKVRKPTFPKIAFENTTYDFEELTSGDKTDHKFTFVNEGKAPLEIKNVHVSCGCTIPSYPFIPIDPGEEGYIGIAYNSVGKEGFQRATVRVITNDPKQKEVVLNIEGMVHPKDKSEQKDTTESN